MSVLRLKENSAALAAGIENAAEILRGKPFGPSASAFKDIRDILMSGVRTNMTGAFTALSPVTLEYKARKGYDSRPLHASGNLAAGLDGKSGATWAKALRGQNEWYAFLHDRGKGFSHWSVEGRGGKQIGSRRQRRDAARPGATKFPERRFFYISGGVESSVISRYNALLETVLDEVGK